MTNVWSAFIQDEGQAQFFVNGLRMLAMVDPEKIQEGINAISHETALGPLLNPTAYLGGERFDNARQYTETLQLALPLVEKLKELKDSL